MSDHLSAIIAKNGDLSVAQCFTCGFPHLVPLPKKEDVELYYTNDLEYANIEGLRWLEKEIKEYKWGLWNPHFGWQAKKVKPGLLLDVGAGSGIFIKYWRKNIYPLAVGIEPSATARHVGLVEMLKSKEKLEESLLSEVDFDVIRFSLVLEHVVDPESMIKRYIEKLSPKGHIMVIVPNEFNPLQEKLGDNYWIDKRHVNYFTPDSLRGLLNKCGLTVTFEGATHPTELWRLAGIENLARMHKLRLLFEKATGGLAFGLYTQLYRKKRWGREIVMVGQPV